jgi:hypothetical protein
MRGDLTVISGSRPDESITMARVEEGATFESLRIWTTLTVHYVN